VVYTPSLLVLLWKSQDKVVNLVCEVSSSSSLHLRMISANFEPTWPSANFMAKFQADPVLVLTRRWRGIGILASRSQRNMSIGGIVPDHKSLHIDRM
jgi:hypothetical protein